MKTVLLIILTTLAACRSSKNYSSRQDLSKGDTFMVTKIDSINNVYVIYARKRDTLYKIASIKENVDGCHSIVPNSSYPFELESIVVKKINGQDISPETILNLGGIDFHGTIIKFERDSILDLFQAKNIRGLCLIRS